jgi:nitrilase
MGMRVAAVQAGSICFDTPATLRKLERFATEASQGGAALAVFPEAFIGGYAKGSQFGAYVGMRTEEGRDLFRRYYEAAISLPGPELESMCEMARERALALVVGVIEKDLGTLYCTAVLIDQAGHYLGKHRKVMPTAMERLVWGFGDGSTMNVVDMGFGKVGAAICWENNMPLLRTWLYSQGIQIYCAPTVDDRAQWQHTMRHIAHEGRCFVIAACQFSRRGDYPRDYVCAQGNDPECVMINGGSVIVSPTGDVLAGPLGGDEGVILAEVDVAEITRVKFDLDVVGHYSRPDIFSLVVNTAEMRPVRVRATPDREQ